MMHSFLSAALGDVNVAVAASAAAAAASRSNVSSSSAAAGKKSVIINARRKNSKNCSVSGFCASSGFGWSGGMPKGVSGGLYVV